MSNRVGRFCCRGTSGKGSTHACQTAEASSLSDEASPSTPPSPGDGSVCGRGRDSGGLVPASDNGLSIVKGRHGSITVPASPAAIFAMSGSAPMVALLPVFSTKVQAASTLDPIEPAGKAWWRKSPGDACTIGRCSDRALLGCTPVLIDRIDVGGQDQVVGSDPLGQERAGPVLVDHRLHSMQFSSIVIGCGNPSSSRTDHSATTMRMVGAQAPSVATITALMVCTRFSA